MNSCDFVGKFKYDPTLKVYDRPSGGETSVVNFVLEISRIFRKKNGEERKRENKREQERTRKKQNEKERRRTKKKEEERQRTKSSCRRMGTCGGARER